VDGQQLCEAFPWDEAPRYVLHDRDHAFDGWADTAKAMGMDDLLTAPRSPWQNADVERFIGSARRECLDHVIVCSATGLQRLMHRYTAYYGRLRTHLSLDKDAPIPRPIEPPSEGRIVAIPQVGGCMTGTNTTPPDPDMAPGTTPDPRIAARRRHPSWRPDVSARLHLRHAHPRSHSSTERHARPQSLSPPGRRKIEFLAGTTRRRR